jgi:molecular chaperone HscB
MAPSDFFSVFSLPRHLNIDLPALEKAFYLQSRRLHPDRFAAKPAAEQEAALAESSRLNDAYRTLKDPILRTQYLLSLEGVELEEQSKTATDAARASGKEKKQIVPPELLEEVFDLNMQLMELKTAKEFGDDDPALRKDLQAAAANFHEKMLATHRELEALWHRWDAAIDANDDSEQAGTKDALVALLNRWSYLRNLIRDVDEALNPYS